MSSPSLGTVMPAAYPLPPSGPRTRPDERELPEVTAEGVWPHNSRCNSTMGLRDLEIRSARLWRMVLVAEKGNLASIISAVLYELELKQLLYDGEVSDRVMSRGQNIERTYQRRFRALAV